MSAAPKTRDCERFDRWMSAYVDEELDAVHCLEVEDHLAGCADCSEIVATLQATRVSLRAVCAVKAPSSLRERVARSMAAERIIASEEASEGARVTAPPSERDAEIETATSVQPPAPQLVRLRYVVPLAAAATFALVFGATRLQEAEEAKAPERVAAAQTSGSEPLYGAATLEGLLEDLVAQHAHPPPPETTDPDGLRRFEPYIGVRVKPPQFESIDATYVGARMHQRAALVQYVVGRDHRVTMYVFDTRRVPLRPRRLEERRVDSKPVYVGQIRGYSVAAREHDGIGYALASDLSDDEAARLVVMAAP